jgi:hypothetical protein
MTPRTAAALRALALRTLALLPLVAAGTGCGAKRAAWEEVRPPEAYVETLPSAAEVAVDGAPVGRSPLSFPVPAASRRYHLQATAPGFEPVDLVLEGSRLAGQRLDLVLRPVGFGAQRRLDLGDPIGLAQAAMTLLRSGRTADALAFADASLAVGETGLAHKAAGAAHRKLGHRNQAIQHYSAYIVLVPDAPDRKDIEAAVEAARGDLTIPPPRAD